MDDATLAVPLPFKSVADADLDIATEEEKQQAEAVAADNKSLFEAMQDVLGDKVEKVAVSGRLTDEPVCLVTEGPISIEMEKTLAGMPDGEGLKSQRVLEVNAKHSVFEALRAAQDAGDAQKVETYTNLLYSQALLMAGLPVDDPLAFVQAVSSLMK